MFKLIRLCCASRMQTTNANEYQTSYKNTYGGHQQSSAYWFNFYNVSLHTTYYCSIIVASEQLYNLYDIVQGSYSTLLAFFIVAYLSISAHWENSHAQLLCAAVAYLSILPFAAVSIQTLT